MEEVKNKLNDTASFLAGLMAAMDNIAQRVSDLEDNDKSGILDSKITALQALVDELIEELMAELRLHRPDIAQEKKKIELLTEQIVELRLLTERAEEAWQTGINRNDIEGKI